MPASARSDETAFDPSNATFER